MNVTGQPDLIHRMLDLAHQLGREERKLAQAIRAAVMAYSKRLARPPRVILLENHGFIALGATPESILATTLMGAKAAEIFAGATAGAGQPRFLTPAQVVRIAGRPDEHYRQQALGF